VPHGAAAPAGAHAALPAQGLPDSAALRPNSAATTSTFAAAAASAAASASAPASAAPSGPPLCSSAGAGRGPHQDPAPLRALQGRPQRAPRPRALPLPAVRRRPSCRLVQAPPFPCLCWPRLYPAPAPAATALTPTTTSANASPALPADDATPSSAHAAHVPSS